jgi:hypothetical protein
MKSFIKKLVLGKPLNQETPPLRAIDKRVKNIKAIWDNERHDDMGIEKIVRLFLAISQFLFLGTYIKQLFGKRGTASQDLSVDIFVLLKVLFPIFVLWNGIQGNNYLFAVLIWFLFETSYMFQL